MVAAHVEQGHVRDAGAEEETPASAGRFSGGFFHGDHQALLESGEGFFKPADLGGVAGIEHAANLALLNTHGRREAAVGQLLFAQGLVERRLGGQDRAGNRRGPAPGRARRRDFLPPRNAARERFLQAVRGFRDRLGECVAVRERLVEVRKVTEKPPSRSL